MTIIKKSPLGMVFGLAVLAVPVSLTAMSAKSLNDHFNPKDILICKNGQREAHLLGNGVGWLSGSTLLLESRSTGEKSLYHVRLHDLRDTAEAKLAASEKAALNYCNTGNLPKLASGL